MSRRWQRNLLGWYAANGRDLPWRWTRSPYRIFVAEIMLQQTQAERVAEKWNAFLKKYPDLKTLAAASPGDVIAQWDGLGYNNRAVRLHRCARLIVDKYRGVFPTSIPDLCGLPGIGRYTASAIACFAQGQPVAVVDINIRRVITRLARRVRDPRVLISERRAWVRAEELLPRTHAYEWNQALMDLGATICTAAVPKCLLCPLARSCPSAGSIDRRRGRPRHTKREPMCGTVPRRLIRGAIVRYLRRARGGGGVPVKTIADHLRDATHGITRRHIKEAIRLLAVDGLCVLRRSGPGEITASIS